jgi:phosphoglycolate phosphatase
VTRSKSDRPLAILFDWDNTLIDSWPTIHAATNVVLDAMGHPTWTLEEAKVRVRHSLRDTFPKMFGDRWEEARDIYYKSYFALHLQELKALPDVAPMLEALGQAGIYLGVVSNKNGDILRKEVEHLGWRHHFGALVGAGDAAKDKPACEPLEMALTVSGIACGSDVWYVGDTGMDMQCAGAGACIPVLLRRPPFDEAEFAPHPPKYRFPDPRNLLDFLGLLKN